MTLGIFNRVVRTMHSDNQRVSNNGIYYLFLLFKAQNSKAILRLCINLFQKGPQYLRLGERVLMIFIWKFMHPWEIQTSNLYKTSARQMADGITQYHADRFWWYFFYYKGITSRVSMIRVWSSKCVIAKVGLFFKKWTKYDGKI